MLTAIIESITDETAVLAFADGQRLRVPLSALSGTPHIADRVSMICALPGNETLAQQAFAKRLLNELIGDAS